MTFEAPRGTHDILPSEQPRWRQVTGEFERLCALYGYRRIDTPVFEDTELFARTSGEGSDVVSKEMYTFTDRGDRSLTLRAEATAPIVRAYLEHGLHREPQPQKLYTHETIYRYGRPQKGRYREHWQLDVEAIGSEDPAVDAEVIQLYDALLGRLGITDYRLELNSIGDPACRPAYLDRLRPWLADHEAELDEDDARAGAAESAARARQHRGQAARRCRPCCGQAPTIGDALCDACREHFAEVRRYLDAFGVRYEVVPTLVRGLDYYTRTTWEFVGLEGGSQSTLSGGGRYDGLAEALGGRPTPGVGFGAGIERLILALEQSGVDVPAEERHRRLLRLPGRSRPSGRARRDASAARGGPPLRRRLCRPVGEGPAHAGGAARREAGRRRRAGDRSRSNRLGAGRVKWRDLYCGDVRAEHVGQRLALSGWVARRRDHGGLVFIDLRDHTGACQLVINPDRAPEAHAAAHEIRNEFVIRAEGEIVARAPDAVNPSLPTGAVELQVESLEILSRSTPLPFQLDEENVDETLRLRYRWLDMRRDQMQRNLRLSHTVVQSIRRTMDERGFIDVWTPSMTRGTPEGARDFLVPVRLQPGRFFALAQSPQLFKQLCMIGGLDRYYQIATCWRDEDLRADRQFEFRQLDIEMAFVEREDVLDVLEAAVVSSFEALGRTAPPRPFPRLRYQEAMARYGTDKPDLRFGLEIQDGTEVTRGSEFGVFAGAEAVRFLVVPRVFSRAELERLEDVAKEWGAKGLAYLLYDDQGEVRSPIAKFLSPVELEAFAAPPGSTVLFAAAEPGPRRPGARRAAPPPRPRARARRPQRRRVPLGDRLPALRA